ncbi:putative ubiquitin domain-containing protein DSK2a [Iris pallida]|uniref:Ubiquitin domain-containing protein DSK2a n=1 Tax=Iris pallida TaxID=29817 RepID=A0AAX6EDQ3_IRIPA|nr:putative ubiquitin domain-containing protein DSK2a [Iris pallida]
MGADVEAAAAGCSGSGAVTVHIRCSNGTKFSVEADSQSAVGAFKHQHAGTCDLRRPGGPTEAHLQGADPQGRASPSQLRQKGAVELRQNDPSRSYVMQVSLIDGCLRK